MGSTLADRGGDALTMVGLLGRSHQVLHEALMEYEYQELRLPRGTSRGAALRLLTDRAEYGRWELARLRLAPDGSRRVWLRRRVIRAASTL